MPDQGPADDALHWARRHTAIGAAATDLPAASVHSGSPEDAAARQAIRLRRFGLAMLTYLSGLGLVAAACMLGLMRPVPGALLAAAMILANVVLYAVFRSGFNLRFADPSLTKQQVYIAVTLLMFGLYHTDDGRGIGLGLCLIVFLFGVFRLTTREFITLTLYTLAAHALVINLMMHWRAEGIGNVYQEWFSWLLLAAVLPWFGVVGGKLSALRNRLQASNSELVSALETIRTMATRDELTGLCNRAVFGESLRLALSNQARHRRAFALFFMDADRFKVINDTLGHAVGDRVLAEIARRLLGCVRESDLVARLGGDEFVLLVEGHRGHDDLERLAAKVVEAVGGPLQVEGHEVPLSLSIGIAVAPEHGTDETTLLRNADAAMYRAKQMGRRGFCIYSEQLNKHGGERLQLEADLGRAVERGELRVYFQPKVAMASGRITGVEALVRWQHPRLGLLAPDRFISIAEESGAIDEIGRWVLRHACERASAWHDVLGWPVGMAVNLSPRQFRGKRLVSDLDAILRETGLDPAFLELEITESMVMHGPEQASEQMRQLRERGVRLAMDDFGTGYSSLGFLKRFPIQTVKIDRSFVRDLPHRADDVAIARAVIAMARSLNMSVTAEGVENEDQAAFLRAEGCESYQGYLCSPPVPETALLGKLDAAAPARGAPSGAAPQRVRPHFT